MLQLPPHLERIPVLHHSIYADDITVWTVGGSDGDIQKRLQQAANIIAPYAHERGLSCSPQKSELFFYHSRKRRHRGACAPDIQVTLQGNLILPMPCTGIFGLRIQENGANTEIIRTVENTADQIGRLFARIANRNHGLTEANLLRLVPAFITSRITYATPFLKFTQTEIARLQCIIRKAVKLAIDLPRHTSTEKLLNTGIYNTFEELVEVQRVS